MENRDSCVFYASWLDAIEAMPDNVRGEALMAILVYALRGETTEKQGAMTKVIMAMVKPQIEANNKRYENGCKGGEFGKLGGRPKKEITPNKPQENPYNDNVNDNDNDKDKVTEIRAAKPPRTRFTPPSIDEVRAYCQERGNGVDAERFIDYYNANGWRVGKNAMKDWKAAVRTWEKNGYSNGGSYGSKKPVPMGATGELGEAELEAIRRVLGE